MAPLTMATFYGISFVMAFIIDIATSVQQSGILSNLYKKAAEENRPMILVLENASSNDRDSSMKHLDYSSNKYEPYSKKTDYKYNSQKSWPYNFYQNSGTHYHSKSQPSNALGHDRDLDTKFQSQSQTYTRTRNHDRQLRVRSRYDDRDDRDRRDEKDRRNRNRYSKDRRDRIRGDRDYERRDRDFYSYDRDGVDRDNRNRYNNRERYDRNKNYYRDDGDYKLVDRTLRTVIQKNLKDKTDDDPKIRALRAFVSANILLTANDLNCEAKDECQLDCDNSATKQDACEDKCKKEFVCDEKKENDCSETGDCDQEDECGGDYNDCGDDKNPSTRGVNWEEDTVKCKRC